MSLVIEYDGGHFVLPKLNVSARYSGTAAMFFPRQNGEEIKALALQIPVNMTASYLDSLLVPENRISPNYNYYKSGAPYHLKSGWDLYLQVATDTFVFAYVLYNPETDVLLYDGSGFSTARPNLPMFSPLIYMFEDSLGRGYICHMLSEPYLGEYGVAPCQIAKDTQIYNNLFIEKDTSDPYSWGDSSEVGGGGGDFDNTSTPIQIPELPSISAASTGFISLFNPTLAQLNELASYMWSNLFDIDGWKKLFADPMDAILGLSILPVAVPSGGAKEVKVGNISTGISLTAASTQFVEVDCGSINVNEYWGAYLDYEPYTQAQIFLPYIGTRPISVDEIMGKNIHVVYHVDILTGACCCFVKCGDSVLYTYNGQCSIPIPITGANYTSIVNGVISVAASVGSLVASGGASAPTAISSIATSAVNQMKPQIEKSGSISGSAGVLNMQTPYLILIRPRQALPTKQNGFIGYPSLITVQLTELSGYTEVQSIHLENIPATQEELAEIESLLKGGVIF